VQTARNYLLCGPSYTALKSPLAVMTNFATFEWLLWQQGSIGANIRGVGKHSTQVSFTGNELYCFEVSIGHDAISFKNWGKIGEGVVRFLSQTNSILLFGPQIPVKNFIRIESKLRAAVGVFTDRLTDASDFIICPMLCYSNGTDNNTRQKFTDTDSLLYSK